MNEQDLISRLFIYGHLQGVRQADLGGLRLSDAEVMTAVQSYQIFFKDKLDDLCLKHHGRTRCHPDGDMGPATAELIALPRCGVPDFAGAEANWPTTCRNNLRTGYSMQLPGLSDGAVRTGWLAALGNWNGSLADVTLTLANLGSDSQRYEVYAKGQRLPGSTLAWSHLARNTCETTLDQRYDTSIQWDLRTFVTTATHELGHALGFGHLGGSTATMTPFINSTAKQRNGFPNEQDLAQARRVGYQIAADPQPQPPDQPDVPDQPDDPAPARYALRGTLQLEVDGQAVQAFIVIPKPGA